MLFAARYGQHQLNDPAHFHYVAPSFWAWKGGEARLKNLAAFVDHVLCILPNEDVACRSNGLAATFVGHPIMEDCLELNSGKEVTPCHLKELDKCHALVLPGGESTAISQIAERTGLYKHLQLFVNDRKKSIWGTCAGLIFLAKEVANQAELLKPLGALDIVVERNAFGRQAQSFVAELDFTSFWDRGEKFSSVFIRAPIVGKLLSDDVKILHKITAADGNDLVVAVRQGNVLGTSFHPELGSDTRFHEWFIREFVLNIAGSPS